jgi:NAD(P)-dependent dehydrogenase (short-subunit alcohol dehydrogenase family)
VSRSASNSSTSRYEREKRKYHPTARRIISGSNCRHLNRPQTEEARRSIRLTGYLQSCNTSNGHEIVSIGRKSGDFQADISNPESLKALFTSIGPFDAVANAAGDVFPRPFEQTTDEQWANSIRSKGMGQINLVRTALPFIADKGSFTLVSGVLTDEYMHGGTIGTTINHLVEGFVKASAVELPRGVRINCISPTVLTESVAYHAYFTGFTPVPAAEVALAYLRAISTPITGRILKLHKTDS